MSKRTIVGKNGIHRNGSVPKVKGRKVLACGHQARYFAMGKCLMCERTRSVSLEVLPEAQPQMTACEYLRKEGVLP